jgi:hypothetical protein
MKIAEIRLARWPGVASALRTRKEPRNAVPTPIPAMAMPARKTLADVSATAANVTAAPAIKAIQPIIIVARADHARTTTVAVPERPVSRKMTRPPQSRFRERNTSPASEGPSER